MILTILNLINRCTLWHHARVTSAVTYEARSEGIGAKRHASYEFRSNAGHQCGKGRQSLIFPASQRTADDVHMEECRRREQPKRKAVGRYLDLGNFEVIIGQMLTQQNAVSNVTKIVKRNFQGELGRNHMKV